MAAIAVVAVLLGLTGGWVIWRVTRATTGQLLMTGLPDSAQVWLDGDITVDAVIELAPGVHELRVEAPGFEPVRDSVTIELDQALRWPYVGRAVPPPPSDGWLMARQLPEEAVVRLDGTVREDNPMALSPGTHIIRVDASGFEPHIDTIQAAAGDTVEFRYAARPVPRRRQPRPTPRPAARAILQLRIVPYATVFIDGRRVSETDILVDTVPAGPHTLRFERTGYETLTRSLNLEAGETRQVIIRMTRNQP